jgi:hypothetical protein
VSLDTLPGKVAEIFAKGFAVQDWEQSLLITELQPGKSSKPDGIWLMVQE